MATQDPDIDPTAEEPFDWDAVARYLAGESTADEARAVRAWLDARPDRAELVAALGRSLDRLAAADVAAVDVEGALAKVRARMSEPARAVERGRAPRFAPRAAVAAPRWRRPAAWLAAAAAAAIVAVGVSRMRHQPASGAPFVLADIVTTTGAVDTIPLPDGSRIVLGPSSSLSVEGEYGKSLREVTLEGDAWFSVVHDDTKPFTVNAGRARIVDVGTVFTVHVDGRGVEPGRVAVAEGSVSLARGRSGRAVILKAGDVATFDSAVAVTRASSSVEDETAWTRGQLVFRDAPLSRVASDLDRWYGIQLRVEDPTIARRRLTATFEKETPEQIMAVIGAALGTTVTRQDPVWTLGTPARGRATGTR